MRSIAPRARNTTAIIEAIKEAHAKGQPVLVGTTSIEKSELLCQTARRRRDPAQRPERPPARAGSADRRRCRQAGRGDHRHQHGRSRHRHPAGRQRRIEGARGAGRRSRRATPTRSRARIEAEHADGQGQGARRGRPVTFWPPSATKAAGSTTSCAAVPAVRVTRAARRSSCRSKTI